MTELHWTFECINSTPFVDVLELFEYWALHPPLHLFIPAALGHKADAKPDSRAEGKDWGRDFFGPERSVKKMPRYMRENPERERRFKRLEELKTNGRPN